jgi:hypothetical protein
MALTYNIANVATRFPSGFHARRFVAAAKAIVAADAITIDSITIIGTQRNGIVLTGSLSMNFSADVSSGRITQIDAIPANLPSGPLSDTLTIAELKANQYSIPYGHIAYANDIVRSGASNGSGVLVYYGADGLWRRIRDDGVV